MCKTSLVMLPFAKTLEDFGKELCGWHAALPTWPFPDAHGWWRPAVPDRAGPAAKSPAARGGNGTASSHEGSSSRPSRCGRAAWCSPAVELS